MTDFGRGLSAADVARLLESMSTPGGLTPLDPAALVYARGTGAEQWSEVTDVPAQTPAIVNVGPRILQVNGREGIARRWLVQVLPVLPDPRGGDRAPGNAADFLRVAWTSGRSSMVADLDLPGGGAAFPIFAQSVQLFYAWQSPAPGTRRVAATCVPILGESSAWPGMLPTRSVIRVVPGNTAPPGVAFEVPRYATAVCWAWPPPPTAAVNAFFPAVYEDENGAAVTDARVDTQWQQLPNGVSRIMVTQNPLALDRRLAAIFRLSL